MNSVPDVVHDVTDPNTWGAAIDEAVNAVRRGALVVLPTDTVYGVAAEAFDAGAVAAIGTAKGRADRTPPPVLVPDVRTLDGLATEVSDDARALADAFWPGALTLVLRAQPSLQWDLGDNRGVVALRMPDHPAALALLRRTGPLAVTGAQRVGETAPLDADAARAQLGDAVAVYLDGGPVPGGGSTVVDATVTPPRVVRPGAIDVEALREVVPAIEPLAAEDDAPATSPPADPEADA
ncbi:Sua5/YciO/YrdC/YwlC family protein [Xylanimonas cellulosilytica DSM 15894]|uniref:L-threonylcarbamoyladenylate synthase n=1 Tax=Xylanimonas cellulosilytica (strain DSM 15894 / JCM 12276 / CECT 5975 / KCTC 9989 / LMG 20990 / NBRC 107835 / XIL07) TaxID=446471 RepID=D1BWC7_XYLCX|nr:L-threonylcarbamoyladenylate synthase [Xylanimonas cellulosilytica]ACZ31472.1 Sua5/YciO/YrdC/YwlC family protein [Xylanimonas cellulosilytica DSM 15894]